MIRSICSLEFQALQNQSNRDRLQIRAAPGGISQLQVRIEKRIDAQRRVRDDPRFMKDETIPRLRKEMHVARHEDIMEKFRSLREQVEMSVEDDSARLEASFKNNENLSSSSVVPFQQIELLLVPQKEKLFQRLIGFTGQIMDTLSDSCSVSKERIGRNKKAWDIQCKLTNLVGCGILPSDEDLDIAPNDDLQASISKLQLIYLVFCKGSRHHHYEISEFYRDKAFKSINVAFFKLCHEQMPIALTTTFLQQTLKTLRAYMNCFDSSSDSHQMQDFHLSDHYIYAQLVHWLKIIIMVRYGQVEDVYFRPGIRTTDIHTHSHSSRSQNMVDTSINGNDCTIESDEYDESAHFTLTSASDYKEFSLAVGSLGNPIIADTLFCAYHLLGVLITSPPADGAEVDYSAPSANAKTSSSSTSMSTSASTSASTSTTVKGTQSVKSQNSENFSQSPGPNNQKRVSVKMSKIRDGNFRKGFLVPSVYEHALPLIHVSNQLAELVVNRYLSWTGFESNRGTGQFDLIEAADEEFIAALKVSTSCFSAGLILEPAFNMLVNGLRLARTRVSSYYVQIALFQCINVAVLCILQSGMTMDDVEAALHIEIQRRKVEAKEEYIEHKMAQRRQHYQSRSPEQDIVWEGRVMLELSIEADTYIEENADEVQGGLSLEAIVALHEQLVQKQAEEEAKKKTAAKKAAAAAAAMEAADRGVGGGDDDDDDDAAISDNASSRASSRRHVPEVEVKVKANEVPKVPLTLKKKMIQFLGTLIPHVILVMNIHRASLTIQHLGLLNLRLLARDLFVKRSAIEGLVAASLDPAALAFARGGAGGDDEDADDGEDRGSSQTGHGHGGSSDASVVTATSSTTLKSTSPAKKGVMAELAIDPAGATSTLPIEEMLVKWKAKTYAELLVSHIPESSKSMSLAELIVFNGETHIQSAEVIEQVLLLIHHIAMQSYVCQLGLVEAGIQHVVKQIELLQGTGAVVANVYLFALCELCAESLEIKDTED